MQPATAPNLAVSNDDRNTARTAYRQHFSVTYDFPVIFTTRLFDIDNPVLISALTRIEKQRRHKLMVFIDQGVLDRQPELVERLEAFVRYHADTLDLVAPPAPLPGGEAVKQGLDHVLSMQSLMVQHHLDRHSFVLAIGGGAILDAVGLAAATAHRGIRHIRIPTTVLSQNDSGVGVKNGVNLFNSKNFFGTFTPPFAVLNDFALLEALPERDKRAGMAEAVKVALIRDLQFFAWLERARPELALFQPDAMSYMIRRCAELHMRQIGQGGDPFEAGAARPLDFGHWAAHRIELLTRFSIRHGEAVAIGIALDTEYSVLAGRLERPDADRVNAVLEGLGFALWHPVLHAGEHALLQGLRDFREHLGGELTVTLLDAIGVGVEVNHIDEALMMQALANLEQRARP